MDQSDPSRRHNLAMQPTALIGREAEVEAVGALLRRDDVRLVTLTGPPGVGKTRLAAAVAAELPAAFDHGVCFVPLDGVRDAGAVPAAIARALGVREAGARPLPELLVAALRDAHRLLVLDTFEHMLPAAAYLADLLAACPRLHILVTSRAALRLRWEREVPLAPLAVGSGQWAVGSGGAETSRTSAIAGSPLSTAPPPPAVGLFVERARAVAPGFELTVENAAAVEGICVRLDGLPLTIELAAGRCKLLSPAAILERLEDRLGLLIGGARDLPERHQTLRAAIAWSYELLPPLEQRLFRRMALFAGGCAPEALEAMGADAGDLGVDIVGALAGLLDQSLVYADERTGRVLMLESIRAYALDRLAAEDDPAAARAWHAGYYAALAEAADAHLVGPEQRQRAEQLATEHDNLRAALAWAIDAGEGAVALWLAGVLARFWRTRGYLSEGRRWLEQVLKVQGGARIDFELETLNLEPARARAVQGLGVLAMAQGDLAGAEGPLRESLALWQEAGEQGGVAGALRDLGNLATFRGEWEAARSLYEESLALARSRGDAWGMAATLNNLGRVMRRLGDGVTAGALYEEALPMARRSGDPHAIALTLFNMAGAAQDRGEHAQARAQYEECLALWREAGDPQRAAVVTNNLAQTAYEQGDYAAAARLYAEGLATFRDLGDMGSAPYAVGGLASVAAAVGQPERAARLLGAAEALFEVVGVARPASATGELDRIMGAARDALGEAGADAAMRTGRLLSVERVTGEALALVESAAGAGAQQSQARAQSPAKSAAGALVTVALSARERDVLRLLVEGQTNREIAAALVLSVRTVESHIFNIYAKIGARGRADATAYALRQGLV